jgi:hypothetical protein
LEDANGKTLEWTNSGSDSLRTPPPPEAIPSLGDSGVVDLSITVTSGTTEKEGVSASFILVRTKWGLVWNRTSLPEGDLYLRAKVKGNRHLDPSSFLYYAITKGIGKEGYAQIYEDHLLSNPVRLHRNEDGRLTASAPEAR